MADRTRIPGANIPNSAACGQWETLLADALDRLLKPEDEIAFREHKSGCVACTALYEEARRGRQWLEFLSAEPEISEGLFDKILARTGPGAGPSHKAAQNALAAAGNLAPVGAIHAFPPVWQRPGFMGRFVGHVRRFAEPRLMMTAAMAFFSVALTLNLTGVRLSQIRLADVRTDLRPDLRIDPRTALRPEAMRAYMERRVSMASVPIIRYYDHLRFVNEVQSRMRELSGEDEQSQPSAPVQSAPPGQSQKNQDGGPRVDPRQQAGEPAQANDEEYGEYLEASWMGRQDAGTSTRAFRRLQSSRAARQEGSRQWTA